MPTKQHVSAHLMCCLSACEFDLINDHPLNVKALCNSLLGASGSSVKNRGKLILPL